MRILFFSNIFPQPHNRLRGIYCLRLCQALAARHDVRVVSPWSWLDQLRHRRAGNQLAADLGGLGVEYPTFYYPPGVLRNTYAWFMWASARRSLGHVMRSFAPQAVVSYWTHPDGAVAVRAARRDGVPAAVMVGGSDALLLTRQGGRRRRIVRVLEAADAVVTVGRDLREKVIGLGVRPEKVHVVARGIDTDLFAPGDQAEARRRLNIPAGDRVLVWVGNMVPLKGLDTLLEACARLAAGGQFVRVYLLGHGPQRKALEKDCAARGLSGLVSFVGTVPQEALPDWYRAADLTVLPSWSEGVPNVLRESLACGTPFVASRVGGIPELVQDPVSRLVPPRDAAAWAEAVAQALAARASAGPVRVRVTGSWDESAERLVRVLRPLVAERQEPAGGQRLPAAALGGS